MGYTGTQEERRLRRARMAADVESGQTIIQVAAHYGVCDSTVAAACAHLNVAPPPRAWPEMNPRTLEILAALLNTTDTLTAIGKRVDRTRSRVSHVLGRARGAGIRFPNRPEEKTGGGGATEANESQSVQQPGLPARPEGYGPDGRTREA